MAQFTITGPSAGLLAIAQRNANTLNKEIQSLQAEREQIQATISGQIRVEAKARDLVLPDGADVKADMGPEGVTVSWEDPAS